MRRLAEIAYSPILWEDSSKRVRAYDTNVPQHVFDAMLERAARHRGYSPIQEHQQDVHTYRSDNVTLEIFSDKQTARVTRSTLLDERAIPGTALVERTFLRSEPLPLYMFSCVRHTCAETKSRRLVLRVHQRARLVFEVVQELGCGDAARCTRRVKIEVDGDRNDADLQRTLENSIHVVLLGQNPKRAAFAKR